MSTTEPGAGDNSELAVLWFPFWVASAGMVGIVVQMIVRAIS